MAASDCPVSHLRCPLDVGGRIKPPARGSALWRPKHDGHVMGLTVRVMWIVLTVWIAGALPASSATRHVVMLFDERPELPGLAALDAEFTRTLASDSADHIELYREA